MKINYKHFILRCLKALGGFALCRFFFKNKILILAYHGSELVDEASFNPNLFMKTTTLQSRLDYLKQKGFNIIGLDDALKRMQLGNLPAKAIVLTFDDGWHSTALAANPILYKAGAPYTIYVTSYYVETQQPVLNVLLRYIFFKTQTESVSPSELELPEGSLINLASISSKNACFTRTLDTLSRYSTRSERSAYVLKVAATLGVDLTEILQKRCFHLMDANTLSELAKQGVDLQLHTHKHNVDLEHLALLKVDIAHNTALLESYVGNKPEHFCYPSGVHDSRTESILRDSAILSATTCLPGFVTKKTNLYYLPRFLDGDNISQLLFEAEVSGVLGVFRYLKNIILLPSKRLNSAR